MSRPNILWISLEDTSPRFGCYGDALARTPNLDRLASQGCRWTHAFSTAGVCAPSRSCIITGCYQTAIGTHHMRTAHTHPAAPELVTPYEAVVPHYVKCFPEYLRAAGYYCTNNDKTDYQFAPPITAWDECGKTAHWRNRPDTAQPFFAVFNPTFTHESGMWPRDGETIRTDPLKVQVPPYLPDTPPVRAAIARHYDNIERDDEVVGRLLRELEEDGLADNTIVFIWSDHGEGLPRGKRWPYDRGIRIPLIVRWPGQIEAGTASQRLVSLVDLAPTVLSLAGADVPRHMHGQPFMGPAAAERQYVFAARDRMDEAYDMVRAVRDRRYKYIRNCRTDLPYLLWIPYHNRHPAVQELYRQHLAGELRGPQTILMQDRRPAEELYDTDADPWELTNLAQDPGHRPVLERLRGALDDWRDRFGDLGETSEAEMVERMWPGRHQPRTAPPVFIPIAPGRPGIEPEPDAALASPAAVQLYCATQGASMAYTTEAHDSPRWRLYTGPIRLPPGTSTIRAVAIRIGYQQSEQRTASFTVTQQAGAGSAG